MARKAISLPDSLPMAEWQRRRNMQLDGNGEADPQRGSPENSGHPKRAVGGGIPPTAWGGSPAARESQDAKRAIPMDPAALRYLPVTGPAIESFEDFRDGRPLEGLGNAALAGGDAALLWTGAGVATAAARGTAKNAGKMTGNAIASQLRRRGVAGTGQEVHHTFELKGLPRNVEDWRNHPAFIKVLPKADHRRLHGKWGDLPKYNFAHALWVGTPTWMKTLPSGLAPRIAQAVASLLQPDSGPETDAPPRPAPYGERPLR